MWILWQELPLYGRKAAQFVDLLGYFVLKTPQTSEKKVFNHSPVKTPWNNAYKSVICQVCLFYLVANITY